MPTWKSKGEIFSLSRRLILLRLIFLHFKGKKYEIDICRVCINARNPNPNPRGMEFDAVLSILRNDTHNSYWCDKG